MSIVLHGGTLLSILCFYHRRIWALLQEDRRVIPLLIVGTIPAGVLGIFLKKIAPEWLGFNLMDGFPAALTAGLMLPITGLLMLSIPMLRQRQGDEESLRDYQTLSYGQAFLIGCFQSFALLPGISRSGSTIFAGILLGLRSQAAATFSFLLAIPAIGGAMTLELKDVIEPRLHHAAGDVGGRGRGGLRRGLDRVESVVAVYQPSAACIGLRTGRSPWA